MLLRFSANNSWNVSDTEIYDAGLIIFNERDKPRLFGL